MNQETINRFQLALFVISLDHLSESAEALEQLAQLYHIRHVWATDNLYRLPHSEGATVIIQSNSN